MKRASRELVDDQLEGDCDVLKWDSMTLLPTCQMDSGLPVCKVEYEPGISVVVCSKRVPGL